MLIQDDPYMLVLVSLAIILFLLAIFKIIIWEFVDKKKKSE
jgi:hypothetical protein